MLDITIVSGSQSFNFDNSPTGVSVRTHEGFEYPEVIEIIEKYPSRPGAVYIDSEFGRRRLSWSGTVLGSDKDNALLLRRNLQKVLRQGAMVTVQFDTDDNLSLQCQANVQGLSMPLAGIIHPYRIELVAPDWRFYDQTPTVNTTGQTNASGGTAIPTAIPLALAVTSGGLLSVENEGSENTPPTFVVSGPGTEFTIQDATNNKSMVIDVTLTAGEKFTVDVLNRRITQNNGQNLYGNFSGTFWDLEPGETDINFYATSGGAGETSLQVTHRHAYRGI